MQTGLDNGKEMYLSLPHITRENPPEGYMEQVKKWLEAGLSGFLVRNLESYSALAQMGLADKCVLDHSLYTWNVKPSVSERSGNPSKYSSPGAE